MTTPQCGHTDGWCWKTICTQQTLTTALTPEHDGRDPQPTNDWLDNQAANEYEKRHLGWD